MLFLFKHIGKVPEAATFDAAITAIHGGITGQTNLAMMRYKLFKDISQGNQPFSIWWSKFRDQAERVDFDNYTKEMAARDAVLFNTSDTRLRKKVLAENTDFEDILVRRMVKEEVN